MLNKSDVFILPSLAEAFGNVFAEAMASGYLLLERIQGGFRILPRQRMVS